MYTNDIRINAGVIWQLLSEKGKLSIREIGEFGIATMWEAVFGDMGVALIAIFNALRILKK